MFSFLFAAALPAGVMMALLPALAGQGPMPVSVPELLLLVMMLAGFELTQTAMLRFDSVSHGDMPEGERC